MEPLDPKLRQLIDDGLPAAMPDDEAEERGLAALLGQLEGPTSAPDIPAATAGASGLGKLALVVAAAVTVGGIGWVAARPSGPPAQAPVQTSAPERTADPPTTAPPSPAPPLPPPPAIEPAADAPRAAAAPIQRRTKPTPKRPQAPTVAETLRAEADLIARAESALDRGKPREARALCDFHRKGFESPQLATEREAIAASATCMIHPTKTTAAEAFVRAHPRSALANKVRQRCALSGGEETPSVQ